MEARAAVSFLIPWYERDELRIVLAANAPVFRALDAEILVINCGGGSEHLRGLIVESEVAGVRQLDLSVPKFNKSLALNAGLAYASADTVFTLDADVILLDAVAAAAMEEGSFVTLQSVYESAPGEVELPAATPKSAFLEFTFRDGVKVRHQLGLHDASGTVRPGTGLLLASKRDLLSIGGYNSDLDAWGWEDDDVLVRLQYVLQRRRIQAGSALHLTHGNEGRWMRGSRGRSSQQNFIKCLRNYNNGVLLGSYRPDVESLNDKVNETVVEIAAGEERLGRQHDSSFVSGPMYCGNENGIMSEWGRDRSKLPPSISALLIEAALMKAPVENCDILEVGSASPRLAAQLSPRCRQITSVVCNLYSQTFRDHLPLRMYDVIIDRNMASHACCQRHLRALVENYSSLLTPAGWLLTAEPGLDGAASDHWELTEAELANLADQFGLCVSRAGVGIYKVTRW